MVEVMEAEIAEKERRRRQEVGLGKTVGCLSMAGVAGSFSETMAKYVACKCYYGGIMSPKLRKLTTDDASWPNQV